MKKSINILLKILFLFLCFFIMYKIHAEDANVSFDISNDRITCAELMGDSLVSLVHVFIIILRIAGAIIAIVSGMLSFVPAIMSDDASALKKAYRKVIILLIVLVCIGLFPTIIRFIGNICGFDVSCI